MGPRTAPGLPASIPYTPSPWAAPMCVLGKTCDWRVPILGGPHTLSQHMHPGCL